MFTKNEFTISCIQFRCIRWPNWTPLQPFQRGPTASPIAQICLIITRTWGHQPRPQRPPAGIQARQLILALPLNIVSFFYTFFKASFYFLYSLYANLKLFVKILKRGANRGHEVISRCLFLTQIHWKKLHKRDRWRALFLLLGLICLTPNFYIH